METEATDLRRIANQVKNLESVAPQERDIVAGRLEDAADHIDISLWLTLPILRQAQRDVGLLNQEIGDPQMPAISVQLDEIDASVERAIIDESEKAFLGSSGAEVVGIADINRHDSQDELDHAFILRQGPLVYLVDKQNGCPFMKEEIAVFSLPYRYQDSDELRVLMQVGYRLAPE